MNNSLLHAGAAQAVMPSEPGLDLAGYVVARRVRAMPLAEEVGEVAVTLAATHTHSAPTSQPLCGCGEVNAAWLQALGEVLTTTAQRAVEALQPARLGSGVGEVPGVAGNRRGTVPATGSAPSRGAFSCISDNYSYRKKNPKTAPSRAAFTLGSAPVIKLKSALFGRFLRFLCQ